MMRLNLLFSAAILAFLLVIDLYSLKYPSEARLFPWVVGIPAAVVMLIQTLKELSRKGAADREEDVLSEQVNGESRAYVAIIAWMVGFLIMIYVLGFLTSIPLFIFLYMKTHSFSWRRSLGLAAGLFIIIYLMFSYGMEMRLYPGLIFS